MVWQVAPGSNAVAGGQHRGRITTGHSAEEAIAALGVLNVVDREEVG